MIVVGLTGGMGMGKSTAAAVFRRAGITVFDADAAVHALQRRGGAAVAKIAALFPGTMRDGAVDRDRLRARVVGDASALLRLESVLHPLVRREEQRFLARARRARRGVVVLDVPLLLEVGGQARVDLVVVVSAPASVQRVRVRQRRQMDEAQIDAVLARQMPDAAKRRLADVVVHTGLSRAHAVRTLRRLMTRLREVPARVPDTAAPAREGGLPRPAKGHGPAGIPPSSRTPTTGLLGPEIVLLLGKHASRPRQIVAGARSK